MAMHVPEALFRGRFLTTPTTPKQLTSTARQWMVERVLKGMHPHSSPKPPSSCLDAIPELSHKFRDPRPPSRGHFHIGPISPQPAGRSSMMVALSNGGDLR